MIRRDCIYYEWGNVAPREYGAFCIYNGVRCMDKDMCDDCKAYCVSVQDTIKYSKGYKYQLRKTAYFQTRIHPPTRIDTQLVTLYPDGGLIIRKYFAWDGASGPTFDTDTNMRGALVHDALCYLMREGLLDMEWEDDVHFELSRYMVIDTKRKFNDGSWTSVIARKLGSWRAQLYYKAVSWFGRKYMTKAGKRKEYIAP